MKKIEEKIDHRNLLEKFILFVNEIYSEDVVEYAAGSKQFTKEEKAELKRLTED